MSEELTKTKLLPIQGKDMDSIMQNLETGVAELFTSERYQEESSALIRLYLGGAFGDKPSGKEAAVRTESPVCRLEMELCFGIVLLLMLTLQPLIAEALWEILYR